MHHGGELLPGIFPRLYGQAWLARHLLLLSVLIAGRCRMLAPSPVCRVILYIHVRSAKTHFGLPHWSACGPRNCHRQLAFPTEECHMSSIPTFRRLPLGPLAAALCLADRKSTRLNSSHLVISYAVFCLKNKKQCVAI